MIHNGQEVHHVQWHTPMTGTIGIVCVRDVHTKERKAYIGHTLPGNTETQDIIRIIDTGAKIYQRDIEDIVWELANVRLPLE